MLVIVNANTSTTNFCPQDVTLTGCDPNQSRSQNQMQNTQKVGNVPDLNYKLMKAGGCNPALQQFGPRPPRMKTFLWKKADS